MTASSSQWGWWALFWLVFAVMLSVRECMVIDDGDPSVHIRIVPG